VWHAVVFVGMLERRHADPRKPRDGMPPSDDYLSCVSKPIRGRPLRRSENRHGRGTPTRAIEQPSH